MTPSSALARVFEPARYLRDANGEVLDTVECDADDAFMALATFETGAIGQLSFTFAGHGQPTTALGPMLYGTRGCLKSDDLFLDGQEPTTLEDYFAQHGAARPRRSCSRAASPTPSGC